MSGTEFFEQRLSLLQIRSIEPFGEPVVDFGKHRARLVGAILRCEQPREARGCAQFPRFRAHLLREHNRLAEISLREFGLALLEPQFTAQSQNFGPKNRLIGI